MLYSIKFNEFWLICFNEIFLDLVDLKQKHLKYYHNGLTSLYVKEFFTMNYVEIGR